MYRRSFFQRTGLGLLAALIDSPMAKATGLQRASRHKPRRLKEGDTIGLIAPAGPVSEEKLTKALDNLAALGLRVKEGASLRTRFGYLAGTDAARLSDLHQAFADPEVDAVWCVRGGYGTTRLLPDLDFDLIRKNPKPFIGYSDITALHLAIAQKTVLVTFHGPVAASDFPEDTLQYFKAALMNPAPPFTIAAPDDQSAFKGEEYKPFTLVPGTSKGALTGGNLSLLSTLAGTAFEPSFREKIVFIEEVGEQPYRVDRMLTQLLQATDLKRAAGIALGVFADCGPKDAAFSFTLSETLRERLGGLGIPVCYGLPLGHVSSIATYPYGIRAELDAEKRTLTFLESGVADP